MFVLPPGYQDHPDLDLYAYIYRYDYLDRLVYKKLPGCAPSYLVYDAVHRLFFSQDGCQRNDSLWSFFVYDVYGRVVVEGECSNSDKHVRTAGETVVLGTLMEGDTGLAYSGYQSSFDLVDPCVYVVNYYDTYDFRTRNGFSAYNFPEGTVSAIGNLTGSILCTHGSSGFIYSADYYDINKRIVKSLSSRVNGGMDTYATEYSFQGSPLSVLHTHTDSSGYSLTERYTYTYDHSSRLTRVSHQYDNNPSVLLLEHTYDELGRLQTDKLDNGIYATDYAYNIRNWLTGIEGGKFSQSLHYTDGLGVPCYNGNISSMTWKSGAGATPRGYKFSYDRLGRLTDAEYGEGPLRSLDVFEVDAAEGRGDGLDRADERFGVGLIDFDVESVDVCERLEQHAFAFHHGLACQSADITQSEDGGAVRNDCYQIAFVGVAIHVVGIGLDGAARGCDAGRIGQ